jgi:hypothetical protein
MIKVLITLLVLLNLNAAVITGSQSKLSISGGSMDVTSGGVTQTVNSGQITFIEKDKAPTTPRKLNNNDLKDIKSAMSMSNSGKKLANFKYAPVNRTLAKKIARFLVKAGLERKNMLLLRKPNDKFSLYLKNIDIKDIKNIYPLYYKALKKYYLKRGNKPPKGNKLPTVVVKLNMIKQYHKTLYIKYGRAKK